MVHFIVGACMFVICVQFKGAMTICRVKRNGTLNCGRVNVRYTHSF